MGSGYEQNWRNLVGIDDPTLTGLELSNANLLEFGFGLVCLGMLSIGFGNSME